MDASSRDGVKSLKKQGLVFEGNAKVAKEKHNGVKKTESNSVEYDRAPCDLEDLVSGITRNQKTSVAYGIAPE